MTRLLFVPFLVGLGLFLAATIDSRQLPWTLAAGGFVLILIGAIGIQYISHKERTRPIPNRNQQTNPLHSSPSTANQTPPEPRVTNGLVADSGTFDVSRIDPRGRRAPRVMFLARLGLGVCFLALDAFLLVSGTVRHNDTLLFGGVGLLPLMVILFYLLVQANRRVVSVTVDSSGISFSCVPSRVIRLDWDDARFGLIIWETPAEVSRNLDPPREGPRYFLATGARSGVGHGPGIASQISRECLMAIVRQAESRALRVTRAQRGRPGTMSERYIYRIGTAPLLA